MSTRGPAGFPYIREAGERYSHTTPQRRASFAGVVRICSNERLSRICTRHAGRRRPPLRRARLGQRGMARRQAALRTGDHPHFSLWRIFLRQPRPGTHTLFPRRMGQGGSRLIHAVRNRSFPSGTADQYRNVRRRRGTYPPFRRCSHREGGNLRHLGSRWRLARSNRRLLDYPIITGAISGSRPQGYHLLGGPRPDTLRSPRSGFLLPSGRRRLGVRRHSLGRAPQCHTPTDPARGYRPRESRPGGSSRESAIIPGQHGSSDAESARGPSQMAC
jgi:hypothetical protein